MTRYTQIINFTLQYLKIHNYLFSSSLLITACSTLHWTHWTLQHFLQHYAFFRKVECLCMQGVHISELSFNDDISGWKMIQYFSFKHKLQRFAEGLYAAPRSIILHLISNSLLASFSFHTNLLSVVSVL